MRTSRARAAPSEGASAAGARSEPQASEVDRTSRARAAPSEGASAAGARCARDGVGLEGPVQSGPASEVDRISLRAARAGDERELARLASAVLPEAWSVAAFAASLAADSVRARVAEAEGALVGFALARRAADEAELLSLCVEPAHQGRGLGRRLAETLLAELRAEGVERVHLEVRGSNVAARALYGSLGFREARRRAGYYRDGEDALELGVAL